MRIRYFCFAGTTMKVELPEELNIADNIRLFEVENPEQIDFSYTIQLVTGMEELEPVLLNWKDGECFSRKNMVVFQKGSLECRLISFEGAKEPYAVYEEVSEIETRIYILQEMAEMMIYDTIFASIFSFEKKMLSKGALLLHCAYMCRDGEAILFSAPSETGKSTQADLWEQYRGTRTINGDASILNKRDGIWYANGWSVCGSSDICHNESYPIKAIVMLYQSKTDICRRLKVMEAYKKLYPQIKMNMWNMEFQNKAMTMMEDLIMQVPVFELGCTISEAAVIALENELKEL